VSEKVRERGRQKYRKKVHVMRSYPSFPRRVKKSKKLEQVKEGGKIRGERNKSVIQSKKAFLYPRKTVGK